MNNILNSPEADYSAPITQSNPITPNSLNTSSSSSNTSIDILNNSDNNVTIVHNNLKNPIITNKNNKSPTNTLPNSNQSSPSHINTSPSSSPPIITPLTQRKNSNKIISPNQMTPLAHYHPLKGKLLNFLGPESKELTISVKLTKLLPNNHEQ